MRNEDIIPGFSIEALKTKDEATFKLVYKKFYVPLLFFAERLTSDRPASEEIVEDVFLSLWDRCSHFEKLESIKAFLYISVRNSCLKFLKKQSTQFKREAAHLFSQSEFDQQADLAMIREEVLCKLEAAIEQLPDGCRKVISMIFLDGLKPQDVAESLKLTISTVRNQQARGIHLLRKKLSPKNLKVLFSLLGQCAL